jgi:hypothetical protein
LNQNQLGGLSLSMACTSQPLFYLKFKTEELFSAAKYAAIIYLFTTVVFSFCQQEMSQVMAYYFVCLE